MARYREDYAERARQLMLPAREARAFVALSDYVEDYDSCPSCGAHVERYESDRCSHARKCQVLQEDAESHPLIGKRIGEQR